MLLHLLVRDENFVCDIAKSLFSRRRICLLGTYQEYIGKNICDKNNMTNRNKYQLYRITIRSYKIHEKYTY